MILNDVYCESSLSTLREEERKLLGKNERSVFLLFFYFLRLPCEFVYCQGKEQIERDWKIGKLLLFLSVLFINILSLIFSLCSPTISSPTRLYKSVNMMFFVFLLFLNYRETVSFYFVCLFVKI